METAIHITTEIKNEFEKDKFTSFCFFAPYFLLVTIEKPETRLLNVSLKREYSEPATPTAANPSMFKTFPTIKESISDINFE